VATEVVLVRHGATEWSENGRHTSHTDLPLTQRGVDESVALGTRLQAWDFALVLTSPMQRARETARFAGFGDRAEVDDDLRELDYGADEGRTTAEIREEKPGWTVWDGSTGGESLHDAGGRADRVIERALRILIARWLGLPADRGRLFALATATVSVLGYEREQRVLQRFNT
jgi:probable phosphoglycerate mutase